MIINPASIVYSGSVFSNNKEYPINEEEQLQQHGIDLRVEKIYSLQGELFMGKEIRNLPAMKELTSIHGVFELCALQPYQLEMIEEVSVPENACALVIMRSTFNRGGVPIFSALFDAGYKNKIMITSYPFMDCKIEKGARVAQIIFMEAHAYKLYNGVYQGKEEDRNKPIIKTVRI